MALLGCNWASVFQIVNDVLYTTNNYKKQYFFYQDWVSWVLQPFKDVTPRFGELSESDRNAIGIFAIIRDLILSCSIRPRIRRRKLILFL